jgi:hypothetical protein
MGATERVTWARSLDSTGAQSNDGFLILVLVIPLFGTSDKLPRYYFRRRVESCARLALQLCGQFSFNVNKKTPAFFVSTRNSIRSFSLTFHAHHHLARAIFFPAPAYIHTFNPLSSACYPQLPLRQLRN